MLYENYRNKVLRLSDFLAKVVKHLKLILTITGIILAAVVTLLATVGLPGEVTCGSEVIYGDSYQCQAKAFLSDVRLEYAPGDTEEWSSVQPYLPGAYRVRAVGRSAFGKDRFGKPTAFSILPCPLQVKIGESSLVFGETPTFLSDATKYGDIIRCDGFVYDNIAAASTNVIPDVEKIQILDANGMDVTHAYDLQPVPVMLTFRKRPLELLVDSTSKTYDGAALTYDQYQLIGGTLGPEDTIIALFTGSQTDAGSSENTCVFTIQHIQNGAAIDVTGQYDLTLTPGTLTVDKRPLTVTTGSLETVYTGQSISCQEFTLDDPSALLPGHTIVAESWGASSSDDFYTVLDSTIFDITDVDIEWLIDGSSVIDCGTYFNIATFKILDENGRDVTANYFIIQCPGTITIKPAQLTVTSESATWEYDGKIHEHLEYTVEGLMPGHRVSEQFAPGATAFIQNAGMAENRINPTIVDENGNDVTDNYVFENHFGTLEVTKRPVTITTKDASWVYDGITHDRMGFVTENLLEHHEAASRNWSNITYVGTKENRCDISIIYRGNEQSIPQDVTDNYDITYVWGTLEITPRPLTIYTNSEQWVYDGQSHDSTGFGYSNLAESDEIHAYDWASITDAGQTVNTCSIAIYPRGPHPDAVGYEPAELTENYDITFVWGTLNVLKRPVTIGVVDEEKAYDGKPLLPKEAYVTDDSPYPLVEGHTMNATLSGSRISVGTSDSKITKLQIFSGDREVTFNYDITTATGTLTVLPAGSSGGSEGGESGEGGEGGEGSEGGDSGEGGEGSDNGEGGEGSEGGDSGEGGEGSDNAEGGSLGGFGTGDPNIVFGQIKNDYSGVIYLRMRSYGDFTGQSWTTMQPYSQTLPGGLSYNYLASIALLNSGGYIHIAEFQNMLPGFYMLPYYISQDGEFTFPNSDTDYTSIKLANYSLCYYLLPSTEDGFEYLKGHLGQYSPYENTYRKYVYQNYLSVDDETRAYMQGIIDKEGFSANDPQVFLKVAKYIQNAAVYSVEYDPALNEESNAVIAFLDKYKEGKCTHYASAATLLLRTLGIPARYTEGWMLETEQDTFTDIKNPGHAWVEVYIDGVGWIQLEVTGGDPNGLGDDHSEEKPSITVRPTYRYKNYDGKTLLPNGIDEDPVLSELVSQGYTYHWSISGSQLYPGQCVTRIRSFTLFDPSGVDVTADYDITYEEGMLEVFAIGSNTIRVYLYQLQKYYDGTPLTFGDDDYEIIEIPDGMTLELSLNISLTDPGALTLSQINAARDVYASYKVYQNGKDITSACHLIFDIFESTDPSYIPIRIDRRPIEITSASQTKQDDGKPLSNDQVFISRGSLVAGHKLVAKASGTISGVGKATNTLLPQDVQILDSNGNDVTAYYDISIIEGLLTVTPPAQ